MNTDWTADPTIDPTWNWQAIPLPIPQSTRHGLWTLAADPTADPGGPKLDFEEGGFEGGFEEGIGKECG